MAVTTTERRTWTPPVRMIHFMR